MTTTTKTCTAETIELLANLETARANLRSADRYTTFSRWYKGEHAAVRAELARAYRALTKVLKGSADPRDSELAAAVQAALDEHVRKGCGGAAYDLSYAITLWQATRDRGGDAVSCDRDCD